MKIMLARQRGHGVWFVSLVPATEDDARRKAERYPEFDYALVDITHVYRWVPPTGGHAEKVPL